MGAMFNFPKGILQSEEGTPAPRQMDKQGHWASSLTVELHQEEWE